MLPIEFAPGVASAEKELKLLVGRGGIRLGEVNETVKGQLDLVTKFVGAPHDSVKGFTSLHGVVGMGFCVSWETRKGSYSCTSENVDVVEMSEDVDDELSRKVPNGRMHVCAAGSLDLVDEI